MAIPSETMFKLVPAYFALILSVSPAPALDLITSGGFDAPAGRSELIDARRLPDWTQPHLQGSSSSV